MAALSILAILTAYATAGPVPTGNNEPHVQTKPFRPSVTCSTEYVLLWSTEYQEREEEVCKTLIRNKCETRTERFCQPTSRQDCRTEQERQCSTFQRSVCLQKLKTVYEPYTESECTTEYKQDCQYEWRGEGNDKVWAPIDGTCQNVPYEQCKEVAKTHARQVAYQECNDVPEQKCSFVPKQVCVTVPDEICTSEPVTECQDVPKQECRVEHKKFPVRISRKEAKKICNVPGEDPALAPAPVSTPVLPSATKFPSASPVPVLPSSPSVVPTFTAPAPVPNSPVFNEQPNLSNQPIDQQRGFSPGPVDQHLDQQPNPFDQHLDQRPQPLDQQGGLSTLDEILAARKAETSKSDRKLSEKLVFSS